MKRFFSGMVFFFRSLFEKPNGSDKGHAPPDQDVDEVARAFYRDLLDAEAQKRGHLSDNR